MRDDELALAATRRLPPGALAGLHEAFAGEVAQRLPALTAAVGSGDPAALAAAVRDAHSLGSSAAVVGEPEASRAARRVEALLSDLQTADRGPWLAVLRDEVETLRRALVRWSS